MDDRRVSLPSFHEIAGSLPKPASTPLSATAPQPIPFSDHPVYRGSNSPSPHHSYNSGYYTLNRNPSSASSSYPHQAYSSPSDYKQLGAGGFGYGLQGANGSGTALAGSKQTPPGNVQAVAHMMADPARQMSGSTAASLPNTLFMHTPPMPPAIVTSTGAAAASSRYAPYHMPKGAAATASAHAPTASPPPHPHVNVNVNAHAHVHAHPQPPPPVSQYMPHNTMHRPQYLSAPGAPNGSSAISQPPKQKGSKREPSATDLMEEEDEDDDVLDYADGHNPMAEDGMGAGGANGMMTTAKIRTIHKLAERRRRREMKNLFDTLRKCLPIDKTIRLSKWEVLKKAIEVISSQDAEIHMLRLHIDSSKALPANTHTHTHTQ
ncbi:hypothetical protein GGI07_001243 [Coemansia sp. Benny D115]|nr:hypothetical protein GGI07_001243 [Coemansia sp. Benny D115]